MCLREDGFMRRNRLILGAGVAVALATSVCPQEKPAAKTVRAVRFGKLWDGKGKLWTNAVVALDGNKIRSVSSDATAVPPGAEVIDLTGYTGLPGLIDVNRNLLFSTDKTRGVPCFSKIGIPFPAVEVFLRLKAPYARSK